MKKLLRSVLAMMILVSGASLARSQMAPISFDQGLDMSALLQSLRREATSLPAVTGKAVTAPVEAKTQRRVSLDGYLRLDGSTHVSDHSRYVTMYLRGNERFSDGEYSTGTVWFDERVSFFINTGTRYISEYVRINKHVSVYKGGTYVGSVTLSGTVRVSGWLNGSWLRLDGSDRISGSFYVNEQ